MAGSWDCGRSRSGNLAVAAQGIRSRGRLCTGEDFAVLGIAGAPGGELYLNKNVKKLRFA